jgi:hypothetical protein
MPEESLLQFLIVRVGIFKAAKVAGYIVAWGLYSDSLADGEVPSVEGCGRWWRRSRPSIYREHAVFRKAFPNEVNPERLWRAVQAQVVERRRVRKEIAMGQLLQIRMDWKAA